jgi:hypothetical protein
MLTRPVMRRGMRAAGSNSCGVPEGPRASRASLRPQRKARRRRNSSALFEEEQRRQIDRTDDVARERLRLDGAAGLDAAQKKHR